MAGWLSPRLEALALLVAPDEGGHLPADVLTLIELADDALLDADLEDGQEDELNGDEDDDDGRRLARLLSNGFDTCGLDWRGRYHPDALSIVKAA
jgi:hypothetical protein